jgi:hypothetical protein
VLAIGSNCDRKDNTNQEHKELQQTRVISTKVSVDQHDRFNLLSKYLYKKGIGKSSTPPALLRHNIEYLLSHYDNEMEGKCCNNSNSLVDHNDSRSPLISLQEGHHNHAEQWSTLAAPTSAVQVASVETKAEPKEVNSRLDEKQLITVLVDPQRMNTADRILIARSDHFVIMIVVDIKTAKVESLGVAARKPG